MADGNSFKERPLFKVEPNSSGEQGEEEKGPIWYLEPGDRFEIEVYGGGEYFWRGFNIRKGLIVTVAQEEDEKKRIRSIPGKEGEYYGFGTVSKIDEDGKELNSFSIDEKNVYKNDKIRVILPQQHTKEESFEETPLPLKDSKKIS